MDEDLPVVDPMTLPLPEESDEERYGVIKPPESPLMARAAMAFRDVERSLEGSPAEFMLPGSGIAQVLERKAYGEDPSAFEYAMAGLDTLDLVPGAGTAISTATKPLLAIFAGPGSVSGYKKIRELLEKEKAGETPEAIFEQTNAFRSPIHGRAQFEIDPTKASLKKDNPFYNQHTPVLATRDFETTFPETIERDKKVFGRPLRKGEIYDESKRYGFSNHFSARKKGPLYLKQVLDFPELLKEYPALEDVKIKPMPAGFSGDGMYDAVSNTIYLSSGPERRVLPTLLHEAQHWVQAYEGFPFGDTPDAIPKNLKDKIVAVSEEYNAVANKLLEFVKPTVKSAMDVKAVNAGLKKANISKEALAKESKKASDSLLALYEDFNESVPRENFTAEGLLEFARENQYPGVTELIKEAPGGAEAFLQMALPYMRRFNTIRDEAFKLNYARRLEEEKALKKYSSTAGEVESRIVENTVRDKQRDFPLERLEREKQRSKIDEVRFRERIPPTDEFFDEFGNLRVPQQKAQGGGVQSLAPIAKNMFRGYDDVKRGVGSYMPHTRYSRRP